MTTPLPGWLRENWFVPFIAAVVAGKLALLLVLGPTAFPDTAAYVDLGRGILENPSWWREGGWESGFAPAQLARPYGYPLLVAGAQVLAGARYDWLLVFSQGAASLGVLALLGWLAGRLVADPLLRAGVLALCALSGFTLFDLAVLTDSFYSSLFITVFLLLAAQMLEMLRPSLLLSMALGGAWAASITLRDVGLLHSFLPLSGVLLVGFGLRLGWRATALHVLAFALPIAVTVTAVVQWNLFRTGHAFFSITGGINWLWPSVNMADRGLADAFACADLICTTAKSQGFSKGMTAVFGIADAIESGNHLDPQQFGRLTFAHFLGAVAAHPLAFLANILGNLQFGRLADLIFNPLANANELAQLHGAIGRRLIPGTRELWLGVRQGAIWQILPLAVMALFSAASGLCLLVAIIGTPIRAIRALGDGGRPALAALYFWAVAAVFIGSYCLVHMEMRHALPTVPLILLAFGWTVAPWWHRGKKSSIVV